MGDINKARLWCGIGYIENMIPTWEDDLGDILQLPYAYCIHDKDKDGRDNQRKKHVHIMLAWNNPTTHKHALEVFNLLSLDGKVSFSTCEAVIGPRNQYDYLIHDTESAKKKGKYQYPASARHEGNNFDIGAYEQLSLKEKNDIAKTLCDCIITECMTNFADFYMYVVSNYGMEYFEVVKTYSGLFERIIKGNYHKFKDSVNGAPV